MSPQAQSASCPSVHTNHTRVDVRRREIGDIFSSTVLVREQDAAGGRTVKEPVVIDDGDEFLPEAPGSNLHIVHNMLPCSRAIRSSSLS